MTQPTTAIAACGYCGRSFNLRPWHGKYARAFCSRDCARHGAAHPKIALVDRFWSKVTKTAGCWLWDSARMKGGYGEIHERHVDGKQIVLYAHRLAWEQATGEPVPEGKMVLHTCDVRNCVRNDEAGIYVVRGNVLPRFGHLALGTNTDNQRDRWDKRMASRAVLAVAI